MATQLLESRSTSDIDPWEDLIVELNILPKDLGERLEIASCQHHYYWKIIKARLDVFGLAKSRQNDIKLILGEAISNAAKHAKNRLGQEYFTFVAKIKGPILILEITNPTIEDTIPTDHCDGKNLLDCHGRGIRFIRTLIRDFPGEVCWNIVKNEHHVHCMQLTCILELSK